jgi:hypothetical protein
MYTSPMINRAHKILNKIHIFLSHHSYLYALIVGVGIVLFWRGVWHTVDTVHLYLNTYTGVSTIDASGHPWWDGPLSLIVGCLILYVSRAFISSFIGNELILSGLKIEKKMTKTVEAGVESEVSVISEIKEEVDMVTEKLEELEEKLKKNYLK